MELQWRLSRTVEIVGGKGVVKDGQSVVLDSKEIIRYPNFETGVCTYYVNGD